MSYKRDIIEHYQRTLEYKAGNKKLGKGTIRGVRGRFLCVGILA